MDGSKNNLITYSQQLLRIKYRDSLWHKIEWRIWLFLEILAAGAVCLGGFVLPKYFLYRDAVDEYRFHGDLVNALTIFDSIDVKNSHEWSNALSYFIGKKYYEMQKYDSAVTYLFETDRECNDMIMESYTKIIEADIESNQYQEAIWDIENAREAMGKLEYFTYEENIDELETLANYFLGKQMYEDGNYEEAVVCLESSSLPVAKELLEEANSRAEWAYICENMDEKALEYLEDLYSTGALDSYYMTFGNQWDSFEFIWNDSPDSEDKMETLYSPTELYNHYKYWGRENISIRELYVYNGGKKSYTLEGIIYSGSSGWVSTSFETVPASGYFYSFFYNENTGEPLAASRVWIE